MYYIITYQWQTSDGTKKIENQAYAGSITNWILASLDYPEDYKLLNAIKISQTEFIKLKPNLN